MKNTIKIAGAGISGLTCAINLGRVGHSVVVFEKRGEVGGRFNNDFKGLENWSSKEDVLSMLRRVNVDTDFYHKGFTQADLVNDLSEISTIRSSDNRCAIYMIKRGTEGDSLDQHLKKHALELGVKIQLNSKMEEEEVDIIATGPKSASGVVCGLKGRVSSADKTVVMLDESCAPKGYTYMAILDGKITLASVVMEDFRRAKKYLQKAIEKLTRLYGLEIKDVQYFGGFGNFFPRESYLQGGRMYVGECAGLQDYLFGFGMKYAFLSGYLASQSILSSMDYDYLLKRELSATMKSSLVNRYNYEKLGNRGYRKLIKRWAASPDPLRYIRTWYNLNWMKRCIYPISTRWYKRKCNRLGLNDPWNESDIIRY